MYLQAVLASKAMSRTAGRHLSSNIRRSSSSAARHHLSTTFVASSSNKSYFLQAIPTIQQNPQPRLTALKQQQCQKHTSSLNPYKSIAIRREGKNRWERRAALTPEAIERLIKETGIKVYVQPSTKRIFSDDKYRAAGAIDT
ncbi:hypothetical protein BGZ65_001234, partial [Modicella reniformis]